MNTNDKLEALRAELAKQDAELDAAMRAVSELPPNVEAHVPQAWLAELESLCAPPQAMTFQALMIGLRA